MQIVLPFSGFIQQYKAEIVSDPDRYRPDNCPQCQAQRPLTAHGFYTRTLVEGAFNGWIRVRRYLCRLCRRTVSLLPDFALPYLLSFAKTPAETQDRAVLGGVGRRLSVR